MKANLMKVIILLLLASVAYGQGRFADDAKEARRKTNEMLIHPIGYLDTVPYSQIVLFDEKEGFKSKEILKYHLLEYMESRDSVQAHFNTGMFCFVEDPITGRCANRDHYRTVIKEPNFADFINYILKQ